MKQHTIPFNKSKFLLGILILLAGIVLPLMPQHSVYATQITNRSLTLQQGDDPQGDGSNGGSLPGGTVNHLFEFTVPNIGDADIGSLKLEYCTTAADTGELTCVTPTGLDTTGATLGNETGATGFTLDATTNGAPILTRTAAAVTAGTTLTYRLDGVVNPSNEETFFVRISTYTSEDTTGSATDTGTVTGSTAEAIVIDGIMPESLVFCTGATVGTNVGGVPDCSTATSGAISFDRLFSPTDTASTTSQMAASTNAGSGYAITVNGPTLTSGSNTITEMSASTTGVRGTSQFGINLKENTAAVNDAEPGIEVAPASDGTTYRGQSAAGYDTIDNFKFTTGDTVANSNGNSSDAQIFTATYMVNVPGNQPAGTYTSTLTYICTATY